MPQRSQTKRTFSLALSLTGGVSTGAYLAGAVDFIIEALDAFQDAKAAGAAPSHAVIVESICGASSGALTAGVAASALRYAFPPATPGADAHTLSANPLYDAWVNMTGAEDLLGTRDRDLPGLRSLLDSTSLERVTDKAITFGAGCAERTRDWIADPLRICFSVTNLEGVPFSLSLNGGASAPWAVTHADVLRYNVCGLGHGGGASAPDETKLFFPERAVDGRSEAWKAFGKAAMASAAFPVLLASRSITRNRADYSRFEVVAPAGDGRPATALRMAPSFASTSSPKYVTFTAADGGIVDNSPTDLARATLNERDVLASNVRGGTTATKAVLAIDPLLLEWRSVRPLPTSLEILSNVGPLLGALIDQARFRPEEVALAQDPTVFSRFMIAPTKDGGASCSGDHLAGSSCHAFGGYLAKAFREHDFFLGRCNAQAYLADQLTLPADNRLFDGWRESRHYAAWVARYANANGELPIVPLIGRLHPRHCPIALPIRPRDAVDFVMIGGLLDDRLDLVHRRLQEAWRPDGLVAYIVKGVQSLFWGLLRRKIRTAMVDYLQGQLRARGLASTPVEGPGEAPSPVQ